MKRKTTLLIMLIVLAIGDAIIPIPFTTIGAIYVLLKRPEWFKMLVKDVYDGTI